MKKFNENDLRFHMPKTFKGLSLDYMIDVIFDEEIQSNWYPKEGDLIVGVTGNIYVISGVHNLVESHGGNLFFFGGGLCNRDGGIILNETFCFCMNKDGFKYEYENGRIVKKDDLYYSKFSDYRYIPYPHELNLKNIYYG